MSTITATAATRSTTSREQRLGVPAMTGAPRLLRIGGLFAASIQAHAPAPAAAVIPIDR